MAPAARPRACPATPRKLWPCRSPGLRQVGQQPAQVGPGLGAHGPARPGHRTRPGPGDQRRSAPPGGRGPPRARRRRRAGAGRNASRRSQAKRQTAARRAVAFIYNHKTGIQWIMQFVNMAAYRSSAALPTGPRPDVNRLEPHRPRHLPYLCHPRRPHPVVLGRRLSRPARHEQDATNKDLPTAGHLIARPEDGNARRSRGCCGRCGACCDRRRVRRPRGPVCRRGAHAGPRPW